MVCVTQQKTCERLIDKGNSLKNEDNMLYVVHVVNENDKLLKNYTDGEALEYLFGITKKLGAELVIERSKNIIDTLVKFADKNAVATVVLGKSPDRKNKFEEKLKKKLKNIEMIII
jgi:K+-sensing histidine kinase KdpD